MADQAASEITLKSCDRPGCDWKQQKETDKYCIWCGSKYGSMR